VPRRRFRAPPGATFRGGQRAVCARDLCRPSLGAQKGIENSDGRPRTTGSNGAWARRANKKRGRCGRRRIGRAARFEIGGSGALKAQHDHAEAGKVSRLGDIPRSWCPRSKMTLRYGGKQLTRRATRCDAPWSAKRNKKQVRVMKRCPTFRRHDARRPLLQVKKPADSKYSEQDAARTPRPVLSATPRAHGHCGSGWEAGEAFGRGSAGTRVGVSGGEGATRFGGAFPTFPKESALDERRLAAPPLGFGEKRPAGTTLNRGFPFSTHAAVNDFVSGGIVLPQAAEVFLENIWLLADSWFPSETMDLEGTILLDSRATERYASVFDGAG